MFNLNALFHPITAQPFRGDTVMHASCPPCAALAPFVACFWGTLSPTTQESAAEYEPSLIVPDACVDLIFVIDHTSGAVDCSFGSFNDRATRAFFIRARAGLSRFAIRFPFWTVRRFTNVPLNAAVSDPDAYFPGWRAAFSVMLLEETSLVARAAWAESFLLPRSDGHRESPDVMNALYHILRTKGAAPVQDVCAYAAVSARQMERLFCVHIGAPPKRVAGLVRYQNLWMDLAQGTLTNVQDAVDKYRYADQAHLLHDFKKYHTVTPAQAIQIARS